MPVRNALGKLAGILMEMEEERHVQEFIDRGVTVEMIKEIDADNSGEVDKLEFLCYMLVSGNSRKGKPCRLAINLLVCTARRPRWTSAHRRTWT